jgi:ribulose-phosphate 3-epimerase
MKSFILSASILSADFSNLSGQIAEAEQAGVDWIHVDVMDGHFVPNITMGPFIVKTLRALTKLPLDVHLMIEKPENFIDAFRQAGADRISIHVENNPNSHRTLQRISDLGTKPGIAVNPGTSINTIDLLYDFVDLILIMSVNPGFSGQQFIPITLEKICHAHDMIQKQNRKIHLEVDGGITPQNINQVVEAGADVIVAATSVFQHKDGITAGIRSLRTATF